jgi:hypothetical protein
MALINDYFRGMLGTPFGGTKHRGYGREHDIQTLQEFGSAKMIRFPSGTGTIPTLARRHRHLWHGQLISFTARVQRNAGGGPGNYAIPAR